MSMDPGAEAVLEDLRKEVDEAKSEMMKWKTLYNKVTAPRTSQVLAVLSLL